MLKGQNAKLFLRDEDGNLVEFGATVQNFEFTPKLSESEKDIESFSRESFPREASFSCEIKMSESERLNLVTELNGDGILNSEIIG